MGLGFSDFGRKIAEIWVEASWLTHKASFIRLVFMQERHRLRCILLYQPWPCKYEKARILSSAILDEKSLTEQKPFISLKKANHMGTATISVEDKPVRRSSTLSGAIGLPKQCE